MIDINQVKQSIAQLTGDNLSVYEENTELAMIKNWDSMIALRLMMDLEKELGVRLPVANFVQAQTLGDLVHLLGEAA